MDKCNGRARGGRMLWSGALAVLLAVAGLAACGGGGDDGGATPNGGSATALTVGPVSGFGSIIVNGIRFDDSTARVFDDDGFDVTDDGGRGELGLGTMVEVESDGIDDRTGRATARTIRFGSEIKGPVASVDTAAGSFVVLGQTIVVRTTTVFDDSLGAGGLAALVGQLVEVHALYDAASARYVATRIESEDDADEFKLRGQVSAHDATAQSFSIGTAVISYAKMGADELPDAFADGLRVRVKVETTQAADGSWIAISVRSGARGVDDHDDLRLRGTVSAFTSPTAFEVDGLPVDASGARIDDGPVSLGAFVELRGMTVDGVIRASRVEVENDEDDDRFEFELHGAVEALDTTGRSFMLHGVRVTYSDATRFDDGSIARLVAGVQVEVEGRLSDDRSTLAATKIEFED